MKKFYRLSMELIDTLWNVNNGSRIIFRGMDNELIDTLWNVNISNVKLLIF